MDQRSDNVIFKDSFDRVVLKDSFKQIIFTDAFQEVVFDLGIISDEAGIFDETFDLTFE